MSEQTKGHRAPTVCLVKDCPETTTVETWGGRRFTSHRPHWAEEPE
ncbi:hypothetical protein [Streptomyces uncialis]|nr:hypothetical protein [Streptomyces uncialis]